MYKRRKYFIQKGLQGEIIFAFLFLMIFIFFITFFNIYFFMDYFISNVLEPDEFTQFSILLSKAYSLIKPKLALLIFVDFIIVGVIALFISHQIAGPGYKIKNSIQKITDGNLNFKVILRKDDKFTDMADNLNNLIDEYRKDILELKENTLKIKTALQTKDDNQALSVLEKMEQKISKYNL